MLEACLRVEAFQSFERASCLTCSYDIFLDVTFSLRCEVAAMFDVCACACVVSKIWIQGSKCKTSSSVSAILVLMDLKPTGFLYKSGLHVGVLATSPILLNRDDNPIQKIITIARIHRLNFHPSSFHLHVLFSPPCLPTPIYSSSSPPTLFRTPRC